MQKWQSHKVVEAGKILAIDSVNVLESPRKLQFETATEASIHYRGLNAVKLTLKVDRGTEEIYVDHDYMNKFEPEVGGYFVKYADGYLSFSPAKPFEEGYRKYYNEEQDSAKVSNKMVEEFGSSRRRR